MRLNGDGGKVLVTALVKGIAFVVQLCGCESVGALAAGRLCRAMGPVVKVNLKWRYILRFRHRFTDLRGFCEWLTLLLSLENREP